MEFDPSGEPYASYHIYTGLKIDTVFFLSNYRLFEKYLDSALTIQKKRSQAREL